MSMVLWKNILLVWTLPVFRSASILGRLISWVSWALVESIPSIHWCENAFFIHFQVHDRQRFIFMSSICAQRQHLRYSFSFCYNHSIRTFFLFFSPVLHWAASHWHEYHIPPAAVHSPPCRFDPHLLLEEFRKYMCHRGITHWDGCLVLPDAWVYLHHIHSVRHYPSTFILFTTIQPFSQPYTICNIQVDPSSSRQRLTAERTSCMNSWTQRASGLIVTWSDE